MDEGKFIMVSVIIPIYNEEKTIVKLQERLLPFINKCEIIFVDGGSVDNTLKLINPAFTCLVGQKGRSFQMNLGAEKAKGDIFFFLHADSLIPDDFLEEIEKTLKDNDAGCFGIKFDSKSLPLMVCAFISNLRAGKFKIMFGDQGIFIKKDVFKSIGGFPSLPIMEDYQFSLNLKEKNIKISLAEKRIITSARRFKNGGNLKTMAKMAHLRSLYRKGCPIEEISKMYKDIR